LGRAGVRVQFKRRLMKMTNVTFTGGGRLNDGLCHYRNAIECDGNTYGIRDVLKANGMRWDAANKVWFALMPFPMSKLTAAIAKAV
jgi:hypothetical protein